MRGSRLRALALLVGAVLAGPIEARDWSGTWAARSADRTYAILSIVPDSGLPGGWRVTLIRPKGSEIDAGGQVEQLGAQVERQSLRVLSVTPDAVSLAGAQPGAGEGGTLRLSALEGDRVVLSFDDPPAELLLSPAHAGETVSSDWKAADAELVQSWPDNHEMTGIYDQDQADRQHVPGKSIDWSVVGPRDAARRAQVQALIAAGGLHSGADFYHAAFVFQHGDEAADYLKAHVLAVAAAARGYGPAGWIAAATLDRYLQEIGKPQVFGTQFARVGDGGMTQEPYDRALLNDGLRAMAGVPPLAAQEKQRKAWEATLYGKTSPKPAGAQPSAPSSAGASPASAVSAAGRSK